MLDTYSRARIEGAAKALYEYMRSIGKVQSRDLTWSRLPKSEHYTYYEAVRLVFIEADMADRKARELLAKTLVHIEDNKVAMSTIIRQEFPPVDDEDPRIQELFNRLATKEEYMARSMSAFVQEAQKLGRTIEHSDAVQKEAT